MSCCNACGAHACACGCGAGARTPRSLYNHPGLDSLAYRVGTYADFRATMQMDLSDAATPSLAALRTREPDDPSMALLDAWAVGIDVLSFYQERIANEGYLRTATERVSVLELGRLVDYRLRPGVAASVYLAYTVEKDSPPVTIPTGARAQSVPAPGEQMQTFETAEPLDARFEWNALRPRLTQPQQISLDTITRLGELWIASSATLLKPNDRLLFLFGDEPSSGTQAVRRVQSVEVQSSSQRSQIVLQPVPAVTIEIIAAASKAIAALSTGGGNGLRGIRRMYRALLLEGDSSGGLQQLLGRYGLEIAGLAGGSPAELEFLLAVRSALEPSPSAATPGIFDFGAIYGALARAPTLQPASSLQLSRSVASALGVASDARPQLLLNFAPRLADSFYRAWASVPRGQASPALSGVFALRLSAPLFGYNAPLIMGLAVNADAATKDTVPYVSRPDGDWPASEEDDRVQLDNAYDGVLPASYLLIMPPPDSHIPPTVAQARSVQTHPRSAYGMSGKTTDIALVNPATDGESPVWAKPGMSTVRGTQVHAQSEKLPLAERVIDDPVGATVAPDAPARATQDSATRLTLDVALDGLKAGRWVIVAGQRSDVPGTDAVGAAELVMLAGVEQGTDPDLPGDTVHSTLVFANQGLAYRYRRDSVSVYANVVRATHGETRREVLGSGVGSVPMQAFALKQPPLTYVSAATADGVQSTLAIRVNDMQWHEVRNLAFVDGRARSFVTAIDDSGKIRVMFGDGRHGARLPSGVENVVATYRNGTGAPGNVRAGQISLLGTRPLGVKDVINPLRAAGGADPETRDQARSHVPLAVLALDRLVSITDYADFARTFGGVGKAVATRLGAQVRVTIAGAADAVVDATSDLYRNLLQALQRYGDPSLSVGLDLRELLALTLSANVGLAADFAWDTVEPRVRTALLDRFGFERRHLAQNAYLSEIVACIQSVRGVAWVDVDAFGALDQATLLAGFGFSDGQGGKPDMTTTALSFVPGTPNGATARPTPDPRVQALPARFDVHARPLPAQLACFLPTVPDTLLLQEAAP